MKAAVLDKWHEFSEPLEWRVDHMYLDILGLVTAGVGNLGDPISLAMQMPWISPDGQPATPDEIRRDWHALKAQQQLKKLHYKYAAHVTKVRLTDEGIDRMVRGRLEANEAILKRYFPDWDEFPADAQLGICSMAWACGAGFPEKFGNFRRAAAAQQWANALAACKIREEGNPGIVPRNKANRLCFANAATVLEHGLDREVLHWPGEASAPIHDAPTDPALVIPAFTPDPNIEAVHEQRDADIQEENTNPETPEAKGES